MKQGRINKQHFINWDIDDLQEYVQFLKYEAPKTEGNKYILSLANEVYEEMLSEIDQREEQEYLEKLRAEEPNTCAFCGKVCEGYTCSRRCELAQIKY